MAVFALGVVGLAVIQANQVIDDNRPPSHEDGTPMPSVNTTALAQYTPVPGVDTAQGATAVAVAFPTPYTDRHQSDAVVYINALRDVTLANAENLTIGAQISAPGAGWACIQLGTDYFGLFYVEGDVYCRISLTWTEWQMAFDPDSIEIFVEEGNLVQVLSEDGTHYDEYAQAKVTIFVNEIGINGPITRFDQRFDFYEDVSNYQKLVIDLKEIFLDIDLRERANELTADAPDLAVADSFAPLMPDGSRSSQNTDLLYQAFKESLTTPGEGHVYNTLLELATYIAGYRCPVGVTPEPGQLPCEDHDYMGLESLTVVIPNRPLLVCDYNYAEDMSTNVLPSEYCTYAWIPANLEEGTLTLMAAQIDGQVLGEGVDYAALIAKLFLIP